MESTALMLNYHKQQIAGLKKDKCVKNEMIKAKRLQYLLFKLCDEFHYKKETALKDINLGFLVRAGV